MKVYLCGPINGCTDEEAKDWREAAKRHFPQAIDPMKRDYRGREDVAYREIVDLDKRDVRAADAVLVNYVKPSVGTSMEVFFAWTMGKPVIVWCAPDASISPWLRYHSTALVTSFDDAMRKLPKVMDERRSLHPEHLYSIRIWVELRRFQDSSANRFTGKGPPAGAGALCPAPAGADRSSTFAKAGEPPPAAPRHEPPPASWLSPAANRM